MHELGDLRHLLIEQSERARVRNHEHGNLVVELRRQVFEINHAVSAALDSYEIETGHPGARRIGAMSAVRREHLRTVRLLMAKISGSDQERGQLAVRASRRL